MKVTLDVLVLACCAATGIGAPAGAEQAQVSTQREFYETGDLKSITPLRNGVRDGVVTYYYRSGLMRSSHEYRDGQQEGKEICYDEYGEVQQSSVYANGSQIHESINGVFLVGPADAYSRTFSVVRYRNGKVSGNEYVFCVEYDERGTLKLDPKSNHLAGAIPYVDGLRHGTAKFYRNCLAPCP